MHNVQEPYYVPSKLFPRAEFPTQPRHRGCRAGNPRTRCATLTAFTVYSDDTHEGLWFRDLVPRLNDAEMETIGNRGNNPDHVSKLLTYDRPDIVLCERGEPVLVVEKTSEVPSGHNVGQRVGRIVRAAEHDVPVIKFMPFDAKKHGEYASLCNLNARILDAFLKMWDIHDVPVMAINWPADNEGELIRDGTQDDFLQDVVRDFLDSGMSNRADKILETRRIMEREYDERVQAYKPYGSPPSSVEIVSTDQFVKTMHERMDGEFEADPGILSRDETVVYKIGMSPQNCRREDPYTGTQFIYDYQHCRDGPDPSDKSRNLVLNCPKIPKDRWLEANPNDRSRKSFLWYATANGIALKDGFIRVVD